MTCANKELSVRPHVNRLIAMHLFFRFVEFSMLYVSKTIVIILLPYGVTVNADLEPKTHHQTPMTCTYGYSHFRHFQNCCNRDGNTIFKYMNYVPIVVATDLEVHFSVLKKGVSQYFSLYSVHSKILSVKLTLLGSYMVPL